MLCFQLNDALEKSVSELEKEKNSRKRVDSDYQDRINQMQELVQVISTYNEYLKLFSNYISFHEILA